MPIPYYVGSVDAFDPKTTAPTKLKSQLTAFRRNLARKTGTPFYEILDCKDWDELAPFLMRYFPECTDLWFKPERIDVHSMSHELVTYKMSSYFEYWWDPEKFDWKYNKSLINNFQSYFTHWWDPARFEPITDYLLDLTLRCGSHLNIWWPGKDVIHNHFKKGDWRQNDLIYNLAFYRLVDFEDWWNPDVVFDNPNRYTNMYFNILFQHYDEHFDTWWNPDLFRWDRFELSHLDSMLYRLPDCWDSSRIPDRFWKEHSIDLCEKAHWCFDTWWDPEKFNYGKNQARKNYFQNKTKHLFGREYLMQYCDKHIDKWYSKVKIRANRRNINLLRKHCEAGYSLWGPDFISMQLSDELSNEEED